MLLISKSELLISEVLKLKKSGNVINFVPTMGNLHDGHVSLVREAKKNNQVCLVSIFVNPLQFENINDFNDYPRTWESDKLCLLGEKVDLLFTPDKEFLEQKNYFLKLGNIAKKLCGKDRKGHFEGVSEVIIKFLKLIEPNSIILGEKDFQQTLIIKKIVLDFGFKTKVKVLPTVRSRDKIALSSRNNLVKNRLLISKISSTLQKIIEEIYNGCFKFSRLSDYKKELKILGFEKVNYLEVLKEKNLSTPDERPSYCRVFISVNLDGIRLIDNMPIKKKLRLVLDKIYCS